jgi:predicted negative regulator of RcsB-dependent stress response
MEAPANDKKRLSQIQTQDLTESKVNDDFVLWLKTHGMNVLLVVLIAACAVLGYRYFQRQALDKASTAWSDFAAAALPESLEQIAKDHADLPQIAIAALLEAADLRLQQVQSGVITPAQGTTPAVLLDEAGRKIALDAADEDYRTAADLAVKSAGGNRAGSTLVVLQSLFGRAAIAESRGDLEASRKLLAEAEQMAEANWQPIAKVAKARIEGLVALAQPITLPRDADLPAPSTVTPGTTTPGTTGDSGATDLFQTLIEEQKKQSGDAPAENAPAENAPATGGQ